MPKPTKQPSLDDQSFGARLIRYRTSRDITRLKLAEILTQKEFPSSPKTIRNWEIHGQIPRGEIYRFLIQKIERAGY